MTTTLTLTPKMLALIEQVTAADAQAELERRAMPKKQRPKATNEAARQLWAPTLRQIAEGNTVVVAPTPETAVSAETKAEIVHMPVMVVAEPEPEVEDAPIAPVVPITAKSRPKRQPKATEAKITLRGLTPVQSEATAPELSLPVAALVEALKAIEAPTKHRTSVLPILKGVVIQAADATVTLTTTDLDVTLQVEVAAQVTTVGTVVVPLKELLATLPTAKKNQVGDVMLRTNDDQVSVTTASGSSTLRCESVSDYPRLRQIGPDDGKAFDLDLEAIASVLPAASKEDSRPILTGILFDGDVVVATDSYRLHECSSPTMSVENRMLIPQSFLAQLVKRGKRAQAVATNFDILVTDETGLVAVSRLIEGEFPNYKSLFPTDPKERIKFDSDQLIGALSNFLSSKPSNTTPVRILASKGNKLPLRMVETDRFDTTVEISGSSPLAQAAYNPRYLRDLVTGGFDHLKVIDALKPAQTERTSNGRRERRLLMGVRVD